jgi:hypothetical protein
MGDLTVLLTVCAVRFEAFVFFSRQQTVAIRTIPLLRTYGLSPQLRRLMFIETRPTSKRSVARLARDSNLGEGTRRDRHAIAT